MGMAKASSNPSIKTISVTKALAAAAQYSANDVLSENATSGTAWTFTEVVKQNGGSGYITAVQVISESENVTPRITVFWFNAIPTSIDNDNVANTAPDSGDLAKYIGKTDVPALESLGTTDSVAIATPSTVGNLPMAFTCVSTVDDIYAIVVTRDVFTQTTTDDLTIRLTIEQI